MIGLILFLALLVVGSFGYAAHRDVVRAEEAGRTPEALQAQAATRDQMVRDLIDGKAWWATPLYPMERGAAVNLQCEVIALAVAEIKRQKDAE